jgi:hypothetical protein
MRRVLRPVLAECGESARQAASKDSYPFLERAVRAFGSTRARGVPGQKSPGQPAAGPRGAVLRGTGTSPDLPGVPDEAG